MRHKTNASDIKTISQLLHKNEYNWGHYFITINAEHVGFNWLYGAQNLNIVPEIFTK